MSEANIILVVMILSTLAILYFYWWMVKKDKIHQHTKKKKKRKKKHEQWVGVVQVPEGQFNDVKHLDAEFKPGPTPSNAAEHRGD